MGDVLHKVAVGTGYCQVFWFFSASVIALVICTAFIFHRHYKILSTDIIMQSDTSPSLSLCQYPFQKSLVSCVTGWCAQSGLGHL